MRAGDTTDLSVYVEYVEASMDLLQGHGHSCTELFRDAEAAANSPGHVDRMACA